MHYPPEFMTSIRKQLLESLEQSLRALDASLFEKYHTNENQVKKSLQHYKNDKHVEMVMLHFQNLVSTLFAPVDVDISQFSLQDATKIVYQVLDASITVMEETYYEETGGKVLPISQLDERFFNDLNSKFLLKYTEARNQI
uniref:50S ribosomal protein L22 n=1 Tax=Lygus hesperus TaxID=30085 RepID=A0A0A9XAZ5_LYGHE